MSKKINRSNLFFIYVKDFIENMRVNLMSERTIETYRESLNNFRAFLETDYGVKIEKVTFDFVTIDVIKDYINHVAITSSTGTRNVRLSALKAYIRYASTKNVEICTLQIQLSDIRHKIVRPQSHNWLTKEQVLLLLEQPQATKIGIRDRFLMFFFFVSGARLNEMRNVRLSDITLDADYPYVRFLGKGNKPRIVPIPDNSFITNFKYYCSLYHSDNLSDEYLFYTVIHGQKNRMSEDTFQRIFKKYGDMARKKNPEMPAVHPHLLRHTYGAQMYRLGLSLPEIAKLLGHSDIATTEIYAETDVEMAAEAMKKMIPKQPEREWDKLSDEDKLKFFGLK